ncbi:VOC family protein [Mesorhizobium sp. B1-1-8]|uniref:VOC family protein n=1 Tax=Mesorhizobium sp. B1-1-8 TaxID=2589976 RepID=UPI00112C922B|nr:VOC family protein [Mesorhizobium sp. B1-1-8]UCI10404.1 VOC family protein [Mesorhizobium sp. B1-1-8]
MGNAIDEYGIPIWVTLTTEDGAAARRFYPALLNWLEPNAAGSDLMPDVYLLSGQPVAGISAKTGSLRQGWRMYLSVKDTEATTKAVIAAGGRIVSEPTTLGSAGRYAVFGDNSGAELAVWQAGEFKGAAAWNKPGAFEWSELITDDIKASADFYGAVFGWELTSPVPSDPAQWREWQVGGRSIAGLLPRPPAMPKEIPPYWDVMFAVTDPTATVETAVSLGATNLMPATDTAHGRIAVLADPVGAVFSVLSPMAGEAY